MDSEFILLELGCADPELGQTENLLKNEIKPSWKIKRGAENLFTYLLDKTNGDPV